MKYAPALGTKAILALSLALSWPGRSNADVAKGPALRILVPAYFYPVPGSPWTRLNAAAQAHQDRVFAIGNPASGPGVSIDPSYAQAFASFRASGGRLLGYVATSYGARPVTAVIADIDLWTQMYPVDGIFLDEMDNVPGAHEDYYGRLYKHVQARIPGGFVVGNPGVSTSESYLHAGTRPVSDALCITETSTNFLTWHADPWVAHYRRQHFYALPYGVASGAWTPVVQHAFAENIGWLYVTDDVLPNPWDTLPSYFEALVTYVATNY